MNTKIHHFSIRLHVLGRTTQAQLPSFTFIVLYSRRRWSGTCCPHASTILSFLHLHLLVLVPYFATHSTPFARICESTIFDKTTKMWINLICRSTKKVARDMSTRCAHWLCNIVRRVNNSVCALMDVFYYVHLMMTLGGCALMDVFYYVHLMMPLKKIFKNQQKNSRKNTSNFCLERITYILLTQVLQVSVIVFSFSFFLSRIKFIKGRGWA